MGGKPYHTGYPHSCRAYKSQTPLKNTQSSEEEKISPGGGGLGAIRIDCSLQFASEWNLELNEKGLWAERGV